VAQAWLALGSSTGEREENLREALRRLARADLRPAKLSGVYETSPVGAAAGPGWFLNMVLIATTTLTAREVLETCLGIERAMGRVRDLPGGPRLIDIDVLAWEQAIVKQPDFELPHPRMCGRRFVLEPLAEISPGWTHPESGRTAAGMLAVLEDEATVRRIGDPLI
jgi:2-amino-4-hydroxy-6-hydroxymethyldihydropteridine diphosphokinase